MKINLTHILIGVIVILMGTLMVLNRRVDKFKQESRIHQQNYNAATDTMRMERDKNGELLAINSSYAINIKDLQDHIDISDATINKLKRELDEDLMYISKLEAEINIISNQSHTDTLYLDTITNSYISKFVVGDLWYNVCGENRVKDMSIETTINEIFINAPLTVGLDENWNIFVHTENPYLNLNKIKGAQLDPKTQFPQPRRWSFGVQAGIGAGYNFIGGGVFVGPYVGVGVGYRLW